MRVVTSTIAGILLSVAVMMPLPAYAITPEDEIAEPEPEPEEPVVEEPVVEEPEEEDEDIVEGTNDSFNKDNPLGDKNKTPVVVPKKPVITKRQSKSDVKVYSYSSKKHFCGAGLQPVTVDGTVSCGRPNQRKSYQQMIAHPKAAKPKRKRHVRYTRSARPTCRPGTKGCTDF